MGGRSSRNKGGAFELEVVKNHQAKGVPAKKVPLSGASVGYPGDIDIGVSGLKGECKKRGSGDGFKTLERWMGENDVLFLKRNRQAPLAVLTWDAYIGLLAAAKLAFDTDQAVFGPPGMMAIEKDVYRPLAHFNKKPGDEPESF